ncbi:MAG: ABC transporter ATP-binding protein [Alphaproteobacteria bacterium]
MIEVERVTKTYGGRRVVEELSLSVPQGAFCVLLGPSGCGKSTTLRMINRLVPFDSGAIRVGGEDVRVLPPEALRRRIGYAIQSVGLFPHWRVADNIATVPRLLGWPRGRVRDRVEQLLLLLRLDPETYRDKYPHQLSGGEQQRVGVARALAADPELLLMDEPFAALDPIARAALQDELLRIQRETRKTIVFVTHDIDEALKLASVIGVLERGRLAQWGTPLDIVGRPASGFVAEFVGGEASGLRLLGLRTVAERVRPGAAACGAGAGGDPLPSNASLRDALAAMIARRTDRLPIIDASGRPIGTILLSDLVR